MSVLALGPLGSPGILHVDDDFCLSRFPKIPKTSQCAGVSPQLSEFGDINKWINKGRHGWPPFPLWDCLCSHLLGSPWGPRKTIEGYDATTQFVGLGTMQNKMLSTRTHTTRSERERAQ